MQGDSSASGLQRAPDPADTEEGDGRGAQRRCRGIPRHAGPKGPRPSPDRRGDGRGAQRRCRGIPRLQGLQRAPDPAGRKGGRQRSAATMQGDSSAAGPCGPDQPWRKGGRQRSAATMQGDSSTSGPRDRRTEPREKGDGRAKRCGGSTPETHVVAGSHCVLAGSQTPLAHYPSPLKGGRVGTETSKPSTQPSAVRSSKGGRTRAPHLEGGPFGTKARHEEFSEPWRFRSGTFDGCLRTHSVDRCGISGSR
jgi:hypothetical protein